jgi:hypothetical protein
MPLVSMSGGSTKYRAISSQWFAYYLRTQDPLFTTNLKGAFYNILLWFASMVLMLWTLVPLWLASLRGALKSEGGKLADRWKPHFWLLLVLPAAVFYLVMHIGQPGYVLWLLPPLVVLAGFGLRPLAHRRPKLVNVVLLACLICGFCVFALAPAPSAQYVSAPEPGFYSNPENWSILAVKLYKYQSDYTRNGIRKWETITRGYLSSLSHFPQDSVVVVYLQDRELSSFVWEYYSEDYTIVYSRWPSFEWVCRGAQCSSVSIDSSSPGDIEVRLDKRIDHLLVIDDRAGVHEDLRFDNPLLAAVGKPSPLSTTYPQAIHIDRIAMGWKVGPSGDSSEGQ